MFTSTHALQALLNTVYIWKALNLSELQAILIVLPTSDKLCVDQM